MEKKTLFIWLLFSTIIIITLVYIVQYLTVHDTIKIGSKEKKFMKALEKDKRNINDQLQYSKDSVISNVNTIANSDDVVEQITKTVENGGETLSSLSQSKIITNIKTLISKIQNSINKNTTSSYVEGYEPRQYGPTVDTKKLEMIYNKFINDINQWKINSERGMYVNDIKPSFGYAKEYDAVCCVLNERKNKEPIENKLTNALEEVNASIVQYDKLKEQFREHATSSKDIEDEEKDEEESENIVKTKIESNSSNILNEITGSAIKDVAAIVKKMGNSMEEQSENLEEKGKEADYENNNITAKLNKSLADIFANMSESTKDTAASIREKGKEISESFKKRFKNNKK